MAEKDRVVKKLDLREPSGGGKTVASFYEKQSGACGRTPHSRVVEPHGSAPLGEKGEGCFGSQFGWYRGRCLSSHGVGDGIFFLLRIALRVFVKKYIVIQMEELSC